MQWRHPFLRVLDRRWLIAKVDSICEASFTKSVGLEPISFALVSYALFVLVLTLKADSLFINGDILSKPNRVGANEVDPHDNRLDLV